MAIDNSTGTLIRDLVQQVRAEEPATRRKANTVTTAIGTTVTGLLAAGTYLVESGTTLPDWVPLIVALLGMAATVLGVSRTKNGMTDSVADRLELELARRIDLNHDHSDPAPAASDPLDLRAAADSLARDILGRHHKAE
ncbi:hypothetical protein M3G04_02270 [Dietzia cinnamea]|uniref:hypothetical protein n=1 Tax=Dietzia cinnamea TaxID=321318 RepID=UPI00223AB04E|nr:hypothetical protein [Dietzia cinnamea]MCT2299735.1 hypothetical protein [Dietzia cinnamea]